MRFLRDMGVSWRVIEWLRAAGHDAVHLRDEGLQRLRNGDIFRQGFAEHRIVLTWSSAVSGIEETYRAKDCEEGRRSDSH